MPASAPQREARIVAVASEVQRLLNQGILPVRLRGSGTEMLGEILRTPLVFTGALDVP